MHILFSRRQPDGNCIWQAAMQYKIPSLRAASNLPNEICILLAAIRMQILQKKATSTLLSCQCFASTLG
jgi:hypothetical protein